MLRTFRALSLLILAVIAVVATACGSGSSEDVKATLDKAFSTPIKSANVNLDVSLKLDGIKQLNGPIKLSVQGPYETGGSQTIPKVDFDIAASAAGQNFSAGFISTGDNAWVGFQGQNYEVGSAAVAQVNTQIKQAGGKNKQGLSQFGVDPKSWLTDAKDEGSEKVAGVDTDHVSAALDVSAFVDDINKLVAKAGGNLPGGATAPQLTPEEKQKIEDVVKNPRFDVYVGKDDNVIRRLSADIAFEVPKDQQAQVGGLTSGTLSFSIEFADVGKPQTITAPASSKPLSELTSQLGGLGSVLGGAAGGSGSSSGSGSNGSGTGTGTGTGTSGSGPSAAALQAYSKCLQKADPSKPAELQKCAELLK
jgi:hypothetical protein